MPADIEIQCTPPKTAHRPLQHRRLRTPDEFDYLVGVTTSTMSGLSVTAPSVPTAITNGRPVHKSVGSNGSWSLSPASPVAMVASSPRKSWEETFQCLSRNLQTICGSNSSIDEMSTSPANGGGDAGCEVTSQRSFNSPVMLAAAVVWNGHDHHHRHQSHQPKGSADVCASDYGTPHQRHQSSSSKVESSSPVCPTCNSAGGGVAIATRNSFQFSPTGNMNDGQLQPLSGMSPPVAPISPMRLRPGWRTVRVLHEETTDRLRQSLTKICLQNNGNGGTVTSPTTSISDGLQQNMTEPTSMSPLGNGQVTSAAAVEAAPKSRQVRMKESLKSGVRVRLDLVEVGCDPDFVVVSVRDVDRILSVWNAAESANMTTDGENSLHGSDGSLTLRQTLMTVVLPKQTKINSLACFITDRQVLYVRERTTELMHVEVEPPDAEMFLPIFREDEIHLTVAMTLHVADDYVIDNSIAIRTIDDRLVVKGHRHRRHSGEETGSCSSDESSSSQSFTLVLALPEGTYSRTVRAALALRERQLLVTALRAPASRRMTCAF